MAEGGQDKAQKYRRQSGKSTTRPNDINKGAEATRWGGQGWRGQDQGHDKGYPQGLEPQDYIWSGRI
eukprot:5199225-Lingulodinium_polyedra.AAC.1